MVYEYGIASRHTYSVGRKGKTTLSPRLLRWFSRSRSDEQPHSWATIIRQQSSCTRPNTTSELTRTKTSKLVQYHPGGRPRNSCVVILCVWVRAPRTHSRNARAFLFEKRRPARRHKFIILNTAACKQDGGVGEPPLTSCAEYPVYLGDCDFKRR